MAPVNTLEEAVYSEQVTQRNFLLEMPAPTRSIKPSNSWHVHRIGRPRHGPLAAPRRRTPMVLAEIGYTDGEIAGFHDKGISPALTPMTRT